MPIANAVSAGRDRIHPLIASHVSHTSSARRTIAAVLESGAPGARPQRWFGMTGT
jgi:hypothetical protein